MLGSDYPVFYLPSDRGEELFKFVKPFLQKGDIIFANLEESLNDNCQCVKKVKGKKIFAFRSPVTFVTTLKNAGFNVLSLANNHSMDFGECGLLSTERVLKKVKIQFATKYGDVATFTLDGVKIALIAVSFGPPPGSILHPDEITKSIKKLSREYPIIIVSVHNGGEGLSALHTRNEDEYFFGENRGNVVKFAHMAIDAGADLIIGHGPHVPRAMEVYKKRLILYSLGNFCTYGWISLKKEEGLAPLVKITIDKKGEFIKGKIFSFIQKKPGGPLPDKRERAFKLIRELSMEDFPLTSPLFLENGEFALPIKKTKRR